MTATKVAVKHACSRCGKKQPVDRMIYSRHTRRHYCADFAACDRRAKRRVPA